MLDMSTTALAVVQRSHTVRIRAESWLGGELLADDIPVSTGSEDRDRSATVPERVQLTVPRRDRGVDWAPGADPTHPLAAYGQQLRIDYGVDIGRSTEWINRGWFVITSASTDGDTVTVQAEGLLALIDEARLIAAFEPSGTLASTAQSLVEPALTVQIDGALSDRAVPVGMQWESDRMGALTEVLDAWPATARVTEDAVLLVEPADDDSAPPVLDLTDGSGGTVIRWQTSSTRDGAFNTVVCQGETSDGVQVQGVVTDTAPSSPFRAGGPFSPLPVPYFFSSPLLTTVAQCRAAAATTLTRLRRSNARTLAATLVPHPGLVTGDVVTVTGESLTAAPCVIEKLSLPYQGDAMALTLRVV